ncbi:MAG: anti-sigma factor [Bacillati bacterium ANGP1]|uniref:Anti-sigma factor n=1 Tax=Candidatus Segetimicrobium genomatis TaxID=2569760 RepID=A0A537IXP1_9BACT|nr:MAG: anti-sigma factor [Terrabacteria group bacterium ANGP1]
MTAWRTSPNRQPGFPRQGRLHRSAPRWLLFVPVTIAAVLVLLGGLIVTFNQRTSALPEDQGLAEQILGVLAGASGRVATLTGRTGASVRFVYDPIRKRGALVVVRLPNLGEDLVYRLWLIDASGPRTVAIFSPKADRTTFVTVRADFARYHSVAVAVGPRTLSVGTGTPILQATLAAQEKLIRPLRHTPPLRME